jgi:hypothetical protein
MASLSSVGRVCASVSDSLHARTRSKCPPPARLSYTRVDAPLLPFGNSWCWCTVRPPSTRPITSIHSQLADGRSCLDVGAVGHRAPRKKRRTGRRKIRVTTNDSRHNVNPFSKCTESADHVLLRISGNGRRGLGRGCKLR